MTTGISSNNNTVQINTVNFTRDLSPSSAGNISVGGGKTYAFIHSQSANLPSASKMSLSGMVLSAVWFYAQLKNFVQTVLSYGIFGLSHYAKNIWEGDELADIEQGKSRPDSRISTFFSLSSRQSQEIKSEQPHALEIYLNKRAALIYKLIERLPALNPLSLTQEINARELRAERNRQVRAFVAAVNQGHEIIQSHALSVKNFCTKVPLTQHGTNFLVVAQQIAIIPPLQEERLAIWNNLTPILDELKDLHLAEKIEEAIRLAEDIRPQLERSNELSALIHAQIASIMALLPVALTISKADYLQWTTAIGNAIIAERMAYVQRGLHPQKGIETQITEQVAAFFSEQGQGIIETQYAEHFIKMLNGWVQQMTNQQKADYNFALLLKSWVQGMVTFQETVDIADPEDIESLQAYAERYFDNHLKTTQQGELVLRAGYTRSEIRAMEGEIYSRHPIVPTKIFSEAVLL